MIHDSQLFQLCQIDKTWPDHAGKNFSALLCTGLEEESDRETIEATHQSNALFLEHFLRFVHWDLVHIDLTSEKRHRSVVYQSDQKDFINIPGYW